MNKRQKPASGAQNPDDKAERLRLALRDNLKKRKAQAKARQVADPETGPKAGADERQESKDG